MSAPAVVREWTVADALSQFGPIPLRRIRLDPLPGTAVEEDVRILHEQEGRLYELVDGLLLEKTLGVQESYLAALLCRWLGNAAEAADWGIILGADGMIALAPGLVRIPDVSAIAWSRLPDRRVPVEPILQVIPNLAVEVLSPGNTSQEMEQKRRDYFAAGVELVWFIDPAQRTATVFTEPDHGSELRVPQTLSGAPLLPELQIPLAKLFEHLPTVD